MWTSSIRIMLSFPNGPKQNIKALMAPDFTTAARYRKGNNIPATAPESQLSMRVAATRLPPETANHQPRTSKTNYVDYSQLKERKWEEIDPGLKPTTVAKPKVDSDRKPKSKKWKKKKKPTKGGSVQSPLAPTQEDAGQPTPTTTAAIASGPPNWKTGRKGPPTNQRKKRVPPLVLPIRNKRLSDDIPSPVTESDGGVALAKSTVGKNSNSDDVPSVVVAAESFFISVMDPDDPRAKLPVPERNVPPVDPNHARLSWTACYDDDCPVHLSDKNGAGWFPCRPYESRRRGLERS